jgi:transposase InsO family protein
VDRGGEASGLAGGARPERDGPRRVVAARRLHEADLTAWQAAAEAALSPGHHAPAAAEQQRDRRRIQELERELRRKEAALAETAALLVLKKKVQAIWGDAGRWHSPELRVRILALIEEAVLAGARQKPACQLVGLSARTVERWRVGPDADARHGPHHRPANQLTPGERATILAVVTSAAYRELSPHQIVPQLADAGRYLASESTLYRILREERLLQHRGRAKAPVHRPPRAHVATGPNQLWSWDITYLKTPVRGVFNYLYLMLDVWSRKVVGWAVHDVESAECAAALFLALCRAQRLDPAGIVLHADNGGPNEGARRWS